MYCIAGKEVLSRNFAGRSSRSVMAKVLNCGLEESEFELVSCYYFLFSTNTRPKGPYTDMGLILSQLSIYMKDFSIK